MSDNKQKKEKQFITAITPLNTGCAFEDIFYALASTGNHKYISFLDSSLIPNRFSSYSYLAWEPEFVIQSSGIKNETMNLHNGAKEEVGGHPLKFLEKMLKNNIFNDLESIYLDDSNINPETAIGQKSGFNHQQGIGQKSGFSHEQGIAQKVEAAAGGIIPPDYKGGFIGYFSYDLKNYIEKLPAEAKKDLKVPLFYLCYYLKFLALNHHNGVCYFIKNYEIPGGMTGSMLREISSCGKYFSSDFCSDYKKRIDGNHKNNLKRSYSNITVESAGLKTPSYFPGHADSDGKSYIKLFREDMSQEKQNITLLLEQSSAGYMQKINRFIIKKYKAKQIGNPELTSNFSKPDYIRAILKAKEHIHNGDIYQANISQRFSCSINIDPADLYYMLRQKNPAPFCAYLSFQGLKIGCSSPERFMFLKDRQVETRPIKGTRPRGKTLEEDDSYVKELKESLKDHAELNMIVDLERNDLGRFCKYGTVKVKEHAVIEKYARVFHLVSTITGQLQEGYGHTDILKAAFPGGSITGAPKIRAMEIIDSLEPTARNIYTGSIGYIGFNGIMDLNIAIRTFVIKNKKFYYNVGGGIVEDSIPENEYQETLDKGLALKETLEFFSQKNMDLLKDN